MKHPPHVLLLLPSKDSITVIFESSEANRLPAHDEHMMSMQ